MGMAAGLGGPRVLLVFEFGCGSKILVRGDFSEDIR
jgi:hypothetical protein